MAGTDSWFEDDGSGQLSAYGLHEAKLMDDSEMARRPPPKSKCNTCGDKDKDKDKDPPPDDNNQKYPDGGYHRGGSSAGVDPSQMSRSDYVAKGGAYISAPDGGYHFGGSSAGKDMMSIGSTFDASGNYVSGAQVPGYYSGYTGTLAQQTLGDCVPISTVNKLAETTGMDPVTAQQWTMKMDADLGLMQGPGGTASTNGLNALGYSNVSTQDLWGSSQIQGNAQTVIVTSPSALTAANPGPEYSSYIATVQQNQQSIGLNLPEGAHSMTVNSVYTASNGTQMVSISNPWGMNYQVPANQLPNYGMLSTTYGNAPGSSLKK